MDLATLRQYLDDPEAAVDWLRSLGVVDAKRGHGNLVAMAGAGLTLDLLAVVGQQLGEHLAVSRLLRASYCGDPLLSLPIRQDCVE